MIPLLQYPFFCTISSLLPTTYFTLLRTEKKYSSNIEPKGKVRELMKEGLVIKWIILKDSLIFAHVDHWVSTTPPSVPETYPQGTNNLLCFCYPKMAVMKYET